MSTIKVNTITTRSGSTITLGESGKTITLACGASQSGFGRTGTFQSTLTNFKYLRKIWKQNTEEERLLGVSLTGIMDHPVLSKTIDSTRWLKEMKTLLCNQATLHQVRSLLPHLS